MVTRSFERRPFFCVQPRQTLQWRGHIGMLVMLHDLAFRVHRLAGKQARAVQIQPRVEDRLVERVDRLGVLLWDVAVAHVFPHHAGVLALS